MSGEIPIRKSSAMHGIHNRIFRLGIPMPAPSQNERPGIVPIWSSREVCVLTKSEHYGEAATKRICHSASGSEGGMAQEISENSVE
jgi:hypothetical protein